MVFGSATPEIKNSNPEVVRLNDMEARKLMNDVLTTYNHDVPVKDGTHLIFDTMDGTVTFRDKSGDEKFIYTDANKLIQDNPDSDVQKGKFSSFYNKTSIKEVEGKRFLTFRNDATTLKWEVDGIPLPQQRITVELPSDSELAEEKAVKAQYQSELSAMKKTLPGSEQAKAEFLASN